MLPSKQGAGPALGLSAVRLELAGKSGLQKPIYEPDLDPIPALNGDSKALFSQLRTLRTYVKYVGCGFFGGCLFFFSMGGRGFVAYRKSGLPNTEPKSYIFR